MHTTEISYNALGNPLNWRNGSYLTWNGRQLTYATLGAVEAINFSYNADGIRTEKYYFNHETPSVHKVKYVLDGTKILAETREDQVAGKVYTLYYFYDEKGEVAGFEYNGGTYFYQKNIQGDVLRICNEGGGIVAEYTYDAWGKVLSVTDANGNAITNETHVANLNPFRYRSYYYDTETGFYYLNSRYYDPEVGRFLNADGIVGANGGITGYNLFAYCNDNPVMWYDPNGLCSVLIKGPEGIHVEDVTCGSNFYNIWGAEEVLNFLMCAEYEELMDFIANWETFTEKKSTDLEGDKSIGYGHKIQDNDPALRKVVGSAGITVITYVQARLLLWYDISSMGCSKVNAVMDEIGYTWKGHEYLALVSVAYNSNKNYRQLMIDLKNGMDPMDAFKKSADGNAPQVYQGILNRRIQEANVYLNGFHGW